MLEMLTNNWVIDLLGIMISFVLFVSIVPTVWFMLKAFRSGRKIHSVSLAPFKLAVTFEESKKEEN